MSDTIHDIAATRIDGTPASLGEYAGKVLLIVNVASKCGFTPQYEALEKLYEAQRDRGLDVVLGIVRCAARPEAPNPVNRRFR